MKKYNPEEVLITEIDTTVYDFEILKDEEGIKKIKKLIKKFIKNPLIKDILKSKDYCGCYAEDYYNIKQGVAGVPNDKISHCVSRFYIKGNELKADIQILDTPEGNKLLKDFMKRDFSAVFTYTDTTFNEIQWIDVISVRKFDPTTDKPVSISHIRELFEKEN